MFYTLTQQYTESESLLFRPQGTSKCSFFTVTSQENILSSKDFFNESLMKQMNQVVLEYWSPIYFCWSFFFFIEVAFLDSIVFDSFAWSRCVHGIYLGNSQYFSPHSLIPLAAVSNKTLFFLLETLLLSRIMEEKKHENSLSLFTSSGHKQLRRRITRDLCCQKIVTTHQGFAWCSGISLNHKIRFKVDIFFYKGFTEVFFTL